MLFLEMRGKNRSKEEEDSGAGQDEQSFRIVGRLEVLQFAERGFDRWHRDWLTVFAQTVEVELNGFAHIFENLRAGRAGGDAAGQIGGIGRKAR